jgi:hypothetical protein
MAAVGSAGLLAIILDGVSMSGVSLAAWRGAAVIASAVLSIVSAIIGGGSVLAGQYVLERKKDKRVWLIRLQKAAPWPIGVRRVTRRLWRATRASMTQPALSRLEAGDVIPTIPLLDRISTALDADLIVEIAPHAA